MTFDFVSDPKFKELLRRDYQELKNCMDVKAAKSVLVLSGSIIEALLIEFFLQFQPKGYTPKSIHGLTFEQLLDLAESEKLLTKREKNLAWVIKDYRNLIHPGREIRKAEKFSIKDAEISHSLIGIIVSAIEVKYREDYGYTADEVINKLKTDWQFRSVYEKVILKLNQTERIKLLAKLIEAEIYEKSFWDNFLGEGYIPKKDYNNLESAKEFVNVLKPLVPTDVIVGYLKQMINEIEAGDQTKAFSLFNLFHEELGYLPPDEIESAVVYIFSLFSSILEKCGDMNSEKTFSTIGKYVKSGKEKQALKEFSIFCAVHFDKNSLQTEMELFEQVYNASTEDNKQFISEEMKKFLSPVENLPGNIREGFYAAAVTQGIIKK
jgi:hypothetical protein